MIDTWISAAFCLFILALCAVLRVIHAPSTADRVVAADTAITIGAAAAIGLCISWGNLFLLDLFIVIVALLYAGTTVLLWHGHGEGA